VPFLATSFPDAMKLYKVSKPAIEKKLAAQGLMLLFTVPWAPQGVYTKKELNSVDDMKGLKWRAYNVGTSRIGELVGAQPVTIQAAELPQALATGVVNSFMSSGGTGYDSKVWETLTHFYNVQAWIPMHSMPRRGRRSSKPPPPPKRVAGRSGRRRPTGISTSSRPGV
jgi:TRAP-type C4-dicarboxylate transport system substrate-binding protein